MADHYRPSLKETLSSYLSPARAGIWQRYQDEEMRMVSGQGQRSQATEFHLEFHSILKILIWFLSDDPLSQTPFKWKRPALITGQYNRIAFVSCMPSVKPWTVASENLLSCGINYLAAKGVLRDLLGTVLPLKYRGGRSRVNNCTVKINL